MLDMGERVLALAGGRMPYYHLQAILHFPNAQMRDFEALSRRYLKMSRSELHQRCLVLRGQDPTGWRTAADLLIRAPQASFFERVRVACYAPETWPLLAEQLRPGLRGVRWGWTDDFVEADESFLVSVPAELFPVMIEAVASKLWLDGGWTLALQSAVSKNGSRTLKLQLAMMRGDELAVEMMLDAEHKRQGYAAAWAFLQGDGEGAYRAFQKLIARRRPELSVFPSWVAVLARLNALAEGDQALFMDRRLGTGYIELENLLNQIGRPQYGKPQLPQHLGTGYKLCLLWNLRHLLPDALKLPPGAEAHLRERGLDRLAEQLQPDCPRPWLPQKRAEEPWQTMLRLLDTQADFGQKATVSTAKTGALFWHLFPPEIVFYHDKSAGSEDSPPELCGKHANSKSLLSRLPDYLTEKDRIALAKVRLGYSGGALLSVDVLRALVGHPRVYLKNRRRDLQERVQQLRVAASQAGGFLLSLQPVLSDDYLLEEGPGTQLFFWTRSPAERQLAPLLAQQLEIPREGEEQLRATLLKWVTKIDVECGRGVSPIQKARLRAEEVRLRVRPTPRGLRFDWVVRCPDLPAYCRSALEGLEEERLVEQGQAVVVERDLVAEQKRFDEVLRQCPSLPPASAFRLEDVAEILDILGECRQAEVALEWPEGQEWKVRRGGALNLSTRQGGGQEDWFALEGELSIDDGRKLELSAALAAARLGRGPFLRLGEHDYLRIDEQLRRQLEQLADLVDPDELRLPALAVPSLAALELTGLTSDEAFQARLESFQEASRYLPEVPRRLQAELRDYQVEGFQWLARHARMGSGACLADDMGLGKTVQAIALMLLHRADGAHLVVCPVSVMSQWAQQLEQFAPSLRPFIYEGKDRRLEGLKAGDVAICSYGILLRDAKLLTKRKWAVAVLDEAQAIKNPESKTARCAFQLKAQIRVATTGTPIENRLSELWSLFAYLNPGLLGTLARFRRRYEEPGPQRARLRALIAPFVLRRLKSQVLQELPPRTEITLSVQLSDVERVQYEELRSQAQASLESGQIFDLLAHLTRLRQACCHPGLILGDGEGTSAKLEALFELQESLQAGHHRALIFSQFTSFLDLVEARLKARGIAYQRLDGSTPGGERRRRVEAFQGGEGEVFLISLKAGGTGLNLTGADYVVHLDPWWNPAAEDQASDRAHRIGQQRPVTIYRLIAEHTIEEKVVRLHGHKRQLAESVLEGRDANVPLDAEQLRELLRMA